ncbi:hypothetical protein DL768_000830 [Monosporascus sp. mg162]|nr:hypothetical protein DL768_000830 [Monosporascus sp. mg162]
MFFICLIANAEANKWAVLIGVDYYISGESRPGVRIHNLKGCVEDVNQVHEYLRESLGVQDSHIYRLTATIPDDNKKEPKEGPFQWPTYENIVNILQKVTREAKSEDLVYLHYSGHGIRASTIFLDLKDDDSLDEALVPTNIACEGGRYIRDVEIASLLQGMVKKGLAVTVVLDCCHSGSADRGQHDGEGDTRVRGIGTIDKNNLDGDISAFPQNELANATKNSAQGRWRKASVTDHWLLGSSGYTFLAACRAQESALEHCQSERLGQLLVTAAEDVTADTVFVEPPAPGQQLEVGCLALPRSTVSLRRPVRLLYSECSGEDSPSKNALNAVREVWERHGTTFAPLIDDPRGGETFQVQVKNGTYDILNGDGQPLQHTVPPLPTDADNVPEKLVRRLTHLAKYYNVLDLKNLGEGNPVSWLFVDLVKKPHTFPQGSRLVTDSPSAPLLTRNYEATADEWVLLRVTNISDSALNITALDLDSS